MMEIKPVPSGLVRLRSFANAAVSALHLSRQLTWQPEGWHKVAQACQSDGQNTCDEVFPETEGPVQFSRSPASLRARLTGSCQWNTSSDCEDGYASDDAKGDAERHHCSFIAEGSEKTIDDQGENTAAGSGARVHDA